MLHNLCEENKYQVTAVCVKSKTATFATSILQCIVEFFYLKFKAVLTNGRCKLSLTLTKIILI